MYSTDARVWKDNTILLPEQATISVFDHGLLYGDGCFEGMRFFNKKIFRLDDHLQRLQRSAAALTLKLPVPLPDIHCALNDLLASTPLKDGYLRLVITRGVGSLGLDPSRCKTPDMFIIADALQLMPTDRIETGLSIITASVRRGNGDGLDPRIKSLNYLNSILARLQANVAGADEALMLNQQGFIAEGSAENIFLVRDGVLLTPCETDGALAGITRDTVLRCAAELNIPMREQHLTPYDAYTADECFLTGTGAGLLPVRSIDGRRLKHCPGELYQRLRDALHERQRQF